jgi:arylsulfatase A-like enzyme
VARPAARRNVIFVITESVRASSVCLEHKDDCKWTPFSNAAVPGRIPFMQMRALDSTTAISLAVMWSGIVPTESRAEIHSAPLLWEYAHAAGIHNAYWTSQNLLFGNQNKFLAGVPLGRTVSATQLEDNPTHETGADDGKAADWVVADIGKLEEPFYGVVQLANTHFPYRIDERYSPFQPQEEATGPGYENEILNRYQDSIYLQDVAIGRMLRGLKARPEAARTIIVFVSDHGEQMREKGAVGHTGTLFEPEIHVPFWIDAPPGTLTADEEAHLRALKDAPLTMLDVFPTMMDLLGLWDAPEIAHLRKKVPGQSLLRGGSPPDHTLYMSNCTELWACAFKNWGVMRGWTKVIAHQADRQWNCYDVHADPGELVPLTNENEPACAELTAAAMRKFGKTPF